jgi:CheY-like chemotaxis protein
MTKRILVVEDEPDLRMLLIESLREEGYSVSGAADGVEALEAVQKEKPDLIVCDVIMPRKDGNQFMKELRKTDFGKDIPFVILTARVQMRDYFEVVGVDCFLEKPVKVHDLLSVVKRAFGDGSGPSGERPGLREEEKKEMLLKDEAMQKGKGDLQVDSQTKDPEAGGLAKTRPHPVIKWVTDKKKILIVEDDESVSAELWRVFSEYGGETKVVCNAAQCLHQLDCAVPDLIVSKYNLADMSGEQMAVYLKTMPRLQVVPVIIYLNVKERAAGKDAAGRGGFVFNGEGKELLARVLQFLS